MLESSFMLHLSIHITVEFFNKHKHKSLMAKAKRSTHLLVSHYKSFNKEQSFRDSLQKS